MTTRTSLVTCDISVSLDGFSAGPNQTLERPFGDGVGDDAQELHSWMFDHGEDHADEIATITDAGAFVMGRNMFDPGRGEWDPSWRGWWGEDPPYHAPVFVLTHHEREPLEMAGGTTFHFVTDGIEAALARAREAAGERNVAIAGGASTVNAYLGAGRIDELRLHVAPVVLDIPGAVRLFDGVGRLDLVPVAARYTPHVTHLVYRRR
jgi:dihydrofolate reductase